MSRKHYRELARVLRSYGNTLRTDNEKDAWGHMCWELGRVLKKENDKFHMGVWLNACAEWLWYAYPEEVA